MLPGALAMGLAGPFIGRIYDRWGTRVLLIPGSIIASAMLWFYTTFDESTPVWVIAVAQTVLSIGLALSFTPLFTASLGFAAAALLLVRLRGRRHRAAGGRCGRHRAHDHDHVGGVGRAAIADGASEVAAGAAGAQAAFMIAAHRVAARSSSARSSSASRPISRSPMPAAH